MMSTRSRPPLATSVLTLRYLLHGAVLVMLILIAEGRLRSAFLTTIRERRTAWSSAVIKRLASGAGHQNEQDDSEALRFALQKRVSHESSWWSQRSTLPFDCTACGKCCKTEGSVWMAPWEVKEASTLLNTSMEHFIATYASHTLQDDSDGEFWVRLQNTKEQACVFLSSENQCRIYQARPAQCRTYPFWPNILASQESWNDEVRLLDTETGASDQSIPYWTPELGGCEGMQRLQPTDISLSSGVPMQEVELQLQDYEFHDRRFPRAGTPVVPVGDNTEDPF